jgi:hypothetical protein
MKGFQRERKRTERYSGSVGKVDVEEEEASVVRQHHSSCQRIRAI